MDAEGERGWRSLTWLVERFVKKEWGPMDLCK
jgi:hypothetical protein